MFCYNCGKEIADTSNFCEYCGTNLRIDSAENKSNNNMVMPKFSNLSNLSFRKLILPAIFAFIFIFGIIHFSQSDARKAQDAQQALIGMNIDYRDQDAFISTVEENQNELMLLFLEAGSIMPQTTDAGLMEAVDQKNIEAVKTLIDYDADVNYNKVMGGWTPLYEAVSEKNDGEMVEILLSAGADPTIPADNGRSLLRYAVATTPYKTIKKILDAGGNEFVDEKNLNGLSALSYAIYYGRTDVADLLIDYGANTQYNSLEGNVLEYHPD